MNNQKMANQGPITQSKNKKSTYMKTTKQFKLVPPPVKSWPLAKYAVMASLALAASLMPISAAE